MKKIVTRQMKNRMRSVHPDALSQQIYQNRTMIHYAFSRAMRAMNEHMPQGSSTGTSVAINFVLPQLFEHLIETSTVYEHVHSYTEEGGEAGLEDGQAIVTSMAKRFYDATKYSTSTVNRRNMTLIQSIALEVLSSHLPMFAAVKTFTQNQLYDENDHLSVDTKQNALFLISCALFMYNVYSQDYSTDTLLLFAISLTAFITGTYFLTRIETQEQETMLDNEMTDDEAE